MRLLEKDWFFYIVLFLVSVVIMNKLLFPGYILTLDMVWPEKLEPTFLFGWNENDLNGQSLKTIGSLPLQLGYFIMNQVLSSWIVQKIVLTAIFFLAGVGAYRLVPVKNKYGKLFAGLLYMVNPFTYVRFLSGQYGVLIGYMLLPFLTKAIIEMFERRTSRNAIKVSIILTLFSFLSSHYIPVAFGILFLFFLVNLAKPKRMEIVKLSALAILFYVLLNLYWIIPYMTSEREFVISQFTEEDVNLFTTKQAIDFNVVFNTAAMYGFWRSNAYMLPKTVLPFWYLLFIFMFFLAVHGFVIKRKNKYSIPLAVLSVISLILATGITHQVFSKLYMFLFNNMPFFQGFREPHKLVAVLVLVYSYFGGIGLADMAKERPRSRAKKYILTAFILLALAVPIVYTYPMMWNGFHGQLESKFYPSIYAEVNDYLNQNKEEFNVLYLPWHGYMDYTWSLPQRIHTPASAIFDKPVIQGIDPLSHPSSSTYHYITTLLLNSDQIKNFGELVSLINVKYIIIDKTSLAPLQPYDFLYNQTDLELVINSSLVVFKNKASLGKFYQTGELINTTDWNELLASDISHQKVPIGYKKNSPINYLIEIPNKKYVVFTQTYSEDWRYGNQKPIKYLGLINAFESTNENRIYYSRFNYYLIGYVVSGLSLAAVLVLCFKFKNKKL